MQRQSPPAIPWNLGAESDTTPCLNWEAEWSTWQYTAGVLFSSHQITSEGEPHANGSVTTGKLEQSWSPLGWPTMSWPAKMYPTESFLFFNDPLKRVEAICYCSPACKIINRDFYLPFHYLH